jgi:hypothetical protein
LRSGQLQTKHRRFLLSDHHSAAPSPSLNGEVHYVKVTVTTSSGLSPEKKCRICGATDGLIIEHRQPTLNPITCEMEIFYRCRCSDKKSCGETREKQMNMAIEMELMALYMEGPKHRAKRNYQRKGRYVRSTD